MSRSDMMPLWTDAYLADTQDLSTIQHGIYFLLLMRCWRSGEARLKNSERALANIARVTLAQWRKHSPSVMAYWSLEGNFWVQKRLQKEWSESQDRRNVQSKRAKKRKVNEPKKEIYLPEKPNENNEGTPAIAGAEAEAEAYTTSLLSARDKSDWMGIREICLKAAGNSIDDSAVGFIAIQPVLNWMNDPTSPCDLQADILPALRDVAARGSPTNLRSFKYFEKPVMRYRDERLAGNPDPKDLSHEQSKTRKPKDRIAAIGDKRRAAGGRAIERFENERLAKEV